MEDLREEPELEEREEEEEEEDEEEEVLQESEADKNEDQSQERQQEEQEKNENNDDQDDDEFLVRPVRNKAAKRASLIDESDDPDDTQALLETNFSVTGLNEIKTERVIPRVNNATKNITMPKRPMSLDLNAPIKFRKLREGVRPEKVTARLIDTNEINLQSRGRGTTSTSRIAFRTNKIKSTDDNN